MGTYQLKHRVITSESNKLDIHEEPNLDAAKLFTDQSFLGQKQNESQGAVIIAEEVFPFKINRRKYTITPDGWYKIHIKNKEEYRSHDIYRKAWRIVEKNGKEFIHYWIISETRR